MKFHLREISHPLIRISEITSRYNFIQISTSYEVLDCLYFIIFLSSLSPLAPPPRPTQGSVARGCREGDPGMLAPPPPSNGTLFRLYPVKTSV